MVTPTVKRHKTLHRKKQEADWETYKNMAFLPRLSKLRALTNDEWEKGLQTTKGIREAFWRQNAYNLTEALQWEPLIDQMTAVQRLVFSIMMYREYDYETDAATLTNLRITSFEDELQLQAAVVGCDRSANLTNASIRQELKGMSETDAQSIANTYNHDVAQAIIQIGTEKPTANRFVYAANLDRILSARDAWKRPQIMMQTDLSARALAKFWFYTLNMAQGTARLEPKEATCDVCKGWINRGAVTLRVAMAHQPPYHPNCPHEWDVDSTLVAAESCERLWMGA